MTDEIVKRLLQNEDARRAVVAEELVHELLWFAQDWALIRNAQERAFLENLMRTRRTLTASEWEWLCDIERRYVECRQREPWRG